MPGKKRPKKKFIVGYSLTYDHFVEIGIEAKNAEEAIKNADSLFEAGSLWQDSPDVPLLYDDYVEHDDNVLTFTIQQELRPGEQWPNPDGSVLYLRRKEAAFKAARLLIEAYRRGKESGGSIDWEDLDEAYEMALHSLLESNEDSP